MCGIVGIINPAYSEQALIGTVRAMLSTQIHRGPDGEGIITDPKRHLALGHRRLAIIDPQHGQQPMVTLDGQLTVVFNGTLYNYLELRNELMSKGHPISSYSDTEVLLYSYREWGENCVNHFLGMFAFAIWDKAHCRLFCARDRIGIKPFYYFFDGTNFVFASEIKAILASKLVKAETTSEGLQDYLTFQFCLNNKTLFKNIVKLAPGHSMMIQYGDSHLALKIRQYWDVSYEIDEDHSEQWFVDHLAALIEDSTRMHLRSDVALGAHLSGGLDSSAIVCLAADLLKERKIKTFTGAFRDGKQFDETDYAKAVAKSAGTDYKEVYIPTTEFSAVLPKLIYYLDEPVAGPGVIPQYYVSQLAAKHVKVVLSGQGGDELFLGYARYLVAYLESSLSGAIFETLHNNPYAVTLASIAPNLSLLQNYKPMLQKFLGEGLFENQDRRYFNLIDRSEGMSDLFSKEVFNNNYSPFESFQAVFNRDDIHSMINKMTYFDLKESLPALLHVEDRTSMAFSLESRVPLLDHRIVEFMAHIPPNLKFSGGKMKHLFKESMRNIVPKPVLDRKDKMGFPTPISQWTKGVGREFVRNILLSENVKSRGLYNMVAVEKTLNNEHEFGRKVWGLLCLELWHRIYIDGEQPSFAVDMLSQASRNLSLRKSALPRYSQVSVCET